VGQSARTRQPCRCNAEANRADDGHHLAVTINTNGLGLSKAMLPRAQIEISYGHLIPSVLENNGHSSQFAQLLGNRVEV
jgi:hypothetical protein